MKILSVLFATILLLAASGASATGEMNQPAGPSASEAGSEASDASTLGSNAVVGSSNVARAILTSDVVDREPVDDLESLTNDRTRVYFFTELRDLEGTRVTHRWDYEGKTMDEVHLSIGGPRWRIWSSKNLDPTWLGEWKASVVSESGEVLASDSFVYAEQ